MKLEEIADDLERVLDFVERWNKNDAEKDVAESAARCEAFLATYQEVDI